MISKRMVLRLGLYGGFNLLPEWCRVGSFYVGMLNRWKLRHWPVVLFFLYRQMLAMLVSRD